MNKSIFSRYKSLFIFPANAKIVIYDYDFVLNI